MEDSKKKPIMIGVIVVCVVLVVVINVWKRTGGGSATAAGKEVWLKCANEECEVEYKIDRKEYSDFMRENLPPMSPPGYAPAMTCEECGEESTYEAYHCDKCNVTYFSGEAESRFKDECPDCGKSNFKDITEKRK